MTTDFRSIAQRWRLPRPPFGKAKRTAGPPASATEMSAKELGGTFVQGDPLALRLRDLRQALERPALPPALSELASELERRLRRGAD